MQYGLPPAPSPVLGQQRPVVLEGISESIQSFTNGDRVPERERDLPEVTELGQWPGRAPSSVLSATLDSWSRCLSQWSLAPTGIKYKVNMFLLNIHICHTSRLGWLWFESSQSSPLVTKETTFLSIFNSATECH